MFWFCVSRLLSVAQLYQWSFRPNYISICTTRGALLPLRSRVIVISVSSVDSTRLRVFSFHVPIVYVYFQVTRSFIRLQSRRLYRQSAVQQPWNFFFRGAALFHSCHVISKRVGNYFHRHRCFNVRSVISENLVETADSQHPNWTNANWTWTVVQHVDRHVAHIWGGQMHVWVTILILNF